MGFDHGGPLRVGVVGVGERGVLYARALAEGRIAPATLGAVCDTDARALAVFADRPRFGDLATLARSGTVDAVVIATPHAEHAAQTLACFDARLHVLCEKPLALCGADCRGVLDAHARLPAGSLVFASVLPLRADPRYTTLAGMLARRELGALERVAWTVTDCFRSADYYTRRPWRGARDGGGGVLFTQCLHQLDLWQWLFGLPERVHALSGVGRRHAIEVEDEVTAALEHADGMQGVLTTSTGEASGRNRLEVTGELGTVTIEGDRFEVSRGGASSLRTLPPGGAGPVALLENFAAAVAGGASLLAPGREGAPVVDLVEALLRSAREACAVELCNPVLEPASAVRAPAGAERSPPV